MADQRNRESHHDARQREAEDALRRLDGTAETLGHSSLARAANRARNHLSGADADPSDRIEVWGRRTARILAVAAVVAIVLHLTSTYILPG